MEKLDERWTCDNCHEEAVSVAWRTEEAPDLEPVDVRARCPVCGHVKELSFMPGTDPNTEETYTLTEWTKRGETEQASRHSVDLEPQDAAESAATTADVALTAEELESFEVKASQCRPPHVASTWALMPPVNEWYAVDVPRLVEEIRRLRAQVPKDSRGGA